MSDEATDETGTLDGDPAIKASKRITKRFERMIGKTVARVVFGGQFFGIVFTDGTFVFADAHDYAMHKDDEISDYWKMELGLLDRAVWEQQEAERTKRSEERQRENRRKHYEQLKAEFEPH